MRSNGSSEGNGELRRHKQWEQQGEQDRWPAPGGVATGERVLVGLDFVFGFPNAFQQHLRWRGTTAWEWSAAADRATSLDEYLELQGRDWFKFGPDEHLPDEPLRLTDRQVKGSPASVFNLAAGAKQVGRGSIRGMAMLHRLLDAVQV